MYIHPYLLQFKKKWVANLLHPLLVKCVCLGKWW